MNSVLEAWLAGFGVFAAVLAAAGGLIVITDALGRRRGRRGARKGKP